MRRAVPPVVVLGVCAALLAPTGAAAGVGPASSAATRPVAEGRGPVAEYVVVYRDGTSSVAARRVTGRLDVVPRSRFTRAVNGFVAELTETQRRALKADPLVAHVEPNLRIRAAGSQADPPWGLDRLDQGRATAALDRRYTWSDTAQGAGIDVYVIDTGIRSTHTEFAGRVEPGRNFSPHGDEGEVLPNDDVSDCDGHGTHVAGTIAGATVGVAKQARIVPVRVLDCAGEGDFGGLLQAIDWVMQRQASTRRRAVANFSLGGPRSEAVNQAVARMANVDILPVVAAGNESLDVVEFSPASEPRVITVGATDMSDRATWFSNFGAGIDVWAPGEDVASADARSDTGLIIESGTSMAAPHVAGVAAVLRSAHPTDVASASSTTRTTVTERMARLFRHSVVRTAGDRASPVRLAQAPTPTSLRCAPLTRGFSADTVGGLRPATDWNMFTGSRTMLTGPAIGTGWTRTSNRWVGTGGDGVVYLITATGELKWFRWDWEAGRWLPGSGTRIGTGWNYGAGLRSVEVARNGFIYVTTSTGSLRIYKHLGRLTGGASWKVWTVGSGWTGAQVLAPNGDGTLYRQINGQLYWYRHTDPEAGPVRWQGARLVGSGWQFADLLPIGAGQLYAVSTTGVVRSYRNVGYLTGVARWDSILVKGTVPMGLGTTLDPGTCA